MNEVEMRDHPHTTGHRDIELHWLRGHQELTEHRTARESRHFRLIQVKFKQSG
jgi:hypothetical protein